MKRKALIVSISILILIALAIILFCAIYFNIGIDITKDIDKIFSESEVAYYYTDTNPYSDYYSLPSNIAKEIVTKHFYGIKFKHTTGYPLIFGGAQYFECGNLSLTASHILYLNDKKYKLTDDIKEAFNKIETDVIAVATLIPNEYQ